MLNVDKKFTKDDAYKALEMVDLWINNIDGKISYALAYITVLMGFTFVAGKAQAIVDFQNAAFITARVSIELLTLYFFYFCSLLSLFFALKARVNNSSKRNSLFFLGTINKLSLDDYISKSIKLDDKNIINDILGQVHANAQICSIKSKWYNKAILFLIISTFLCFTCLMFKLI